jgi:hypothetical protein
LRFREWLVLLYKKMISYHKKGEYYEKY